jgi:nickel-dependent lactate racemase
MDFVTPFRNREMRMAMPEENLVETLDMHYLPPVQNFDGVVREALAAPIGSEKLCDMVQPGTKVNVLTGYYPYLPALGSILFDVLQESGVRREDTTLLIAEGTHDHGNYVDVWNERIGPFERRAGRVVKHDPDDPSGLQLVGVTRFGNAVWVNRLLCEADVNIGIGDITPGWYGWRGGGKMILPGAASRDTIGYNHRLVLSPKVRPGAADDNPLRLDCEEAARLAGLDMKVDLVLNSRMECVGVTAGNVVAEHRAALVKARAIWGTPMDEKADIAVFYGGREVGNFINGIYATLLSANLATADDAIIIVVMSCSEGLATTNAETLRMYTTPLEQYMRQLLHWEFPEMCHVAIPYPHRKVLAEKQVFLVNEGLSTDEAMRLGVSYSTKSFDDALDKAFQSKGRDAKIVRIPVTFGEHRGTPIPLSA